MDAVELPYPVDVAVPAPVCKLMGSDGFGRAAAGTSVKEAELRDFDRPVTLASSSIGRLSTPQSNKDVSGAVHASGSLVLEKSASTVCLRQSDLLPSFKNEDMCPKPLTGYTKLNHLPGGDECQLPFRAGKDSTYNGKCSKRARISREEESSSSRITDANELGDPTNKSLMKSASLERSQSGKQRNVGGKRGDKRNFKVPMKMKNDYFPLTGCSSISSLSTGGSTVLGMHGLKSDIHEVTKLANDLSLSEILDGTFKCPVLGKEKGKKAINANEPIMQSVRKAFSMLQLVKSSKSNNLCDLDNSEDKKVCSSLLNSVSLGESGVNGDCGDPSSVELPSSNEDSCIKSEVILVHPLDKPLYQPLDLFKNLALPRPKDLDSLLLEASKPISSSKSASDLRVGKQVLARRGGLPPFPWSHASNGHSRTNSDAAKLHTTKATCPGKWVRMKNPAALFRVASDGFTDLDSISYDQRLVPCEKVEIVASKCKIAGRDSPALASNGLGSSSSATCLCEPPLESREDTDSQLLAGQSSSLIAAAQTLCEIATSSPKKSFNTEKWLKQHTQKAVKARKLKLGSDEHKELLTGRPTWPNGLLTHPEKIWASKKPKLSTVERCNSKPPISWATPRSSRSSPSRLVRESISETKPAIDNITKPRKSTLLPEWSKGRDVLQ